MGFLGDIYAARGRALPERTSPYVFADKGAYVSPIDRTVVDGRTAHREHMNRHGVLEAGDMKLGEMSSEDRAPLPRPGHDIKRAIEELSR